MMGRYSSFKYLFATALLCGSAGLTVHAAEETNAWPCEQVFVSEVSAGVLWAGPPLDEIDPHAWRSDVPLAKLVRDIAAQFSPEGNAETKLATYLKSIPAEQKEQKLTLAFSGVLGVLNSRRAKYMTGILKFSRQQAARAKLIDEGLAKLAKLKSKHAPENEIGELEEQLIWQERMFDDRERSIRFLCEQPVNVEVVMADLARTLFNQLDQ